MLMKTSMVIQLVIFISQIIHAYLNVLKRHNSGIETIDCHEMDRIMKTPYEAKHLLLKTCIC